MQNESEVFSLEMEVRDYECDMQGIVNNSVYQNYLEHARHVYLRSVGIDFGEYARMGVNLVVVRAELDYRSPLKGGDRFSVSVEMRRESALRFAFHQEIVRVPDGKVAVRAKIIGTALNGRNRPEIPAALDALMSIGDA